MCLIYLMVTYELSLVLHTALEFNYKKENAFVLTGRRRIVHFLPLIHYVIVAFVDLLSMPPTALTRTFSFYFPYNLNISSVVWPHSGL